MLLTPYEEAINSLTVVLEQLKMNACRLHRVVEKCDDTFLYIYCKFLKGLSHYGYSHHWYRSWYHVFSGRDD